VQLQRTGPPGGERVTLRVTDTGQGIDAKFLPFVFDRFRQADATPNRTNSGLGLGLAIVRHLVEQHGGTVQAQSDGRDRGATFVIRIPMALAESLDGGDDQSRDAAVGGRAGADGGLPHTLEGVRVLVVDDESDSRELMVEVLADSHARVSEAYSAADGLARLQEDPPDVLVSDIGMPGADGLDFIKAVRALPLEKGALTPAVALTGHARSEDRDRALRAGFDLHLVKPVSPSDLVLMVSRLAGRLPDRPPPPRPAEPSTPSRTKATLLLIEDAPDLQELLSEMLTAAGYRVVAAAHGGEGLDRLRSGTPINLILLDLMMPVMDGWRFREAQLHDPSFAAIPVVVISANAEQGGRRIEADAVIPKPVDFDQLLRTIDRHTRDGTRRPITRPGCLPS
jgi:CheY-like chemotaxis protein